MKHTANILTFSRIVMSVIILFLSPFSVGFYICYTLCGVSDILDGFVARKTHSESSFGAMLDSTADLTMLISTGIVVLPILWKDFSDCVLLLSIVVGIIKISGCIIAGIRFKRFVLFHTFLNKLTGLLLFLVPYFLYRNVTIFLYAVCFVAATAALEEFIIDIKIKTYNPNIKSIFKI